MAREKYWSLGKSTRSHAGQASRYAFGAPISAKIIVIKACVINIPVTPTLPAGPQVSKSTDFASYFAPTTSLRLGRLRAISTISCLHFMCMAKQIL